jgi:hypothetical protein
MEVFQIYILISIVVLLIIAILFFFLSKNKKKKTFSPLATIAFAFVLAGICFGDNRIIGYSLIGTGIIFAIIDIAKNKKTKK